MATIAEEYVRTAEATAMLGISRATLHRWAKAGVVHAIKLGPRLVVFRRRELEGLTDQPPNAAPDRPTGGRAPLTEAQKQQALAALDALQELRERQLARLGGRPEPIANSWELINQLRDERARYLSGEDDE